MAPRVKDSAFHAAVTKQIVLDTLPYIAALQPPPATKPQSTEPKPRVAATANMARATKLEAPLMPRGLRTDLTALAKAALAGLGIPFALVVLRSLVF
jgi:hypothetical protein